jgi:hypothetical protein
MYRTKETLLIILLIIPAVALAHGEEVIYTFFIQIISIIICLITLSTIKLGTKIRSILLGIYFLSAIAVFGITNGMPYRDNMRLINLSVGFAPPLITGFTYLLLRLLKVR